MNDSATPPAFTLGQKIDQLIAGLGKPRLRRQYNAQMDWVDWVCFTAPRAAFGRGRTPAAAWRDWQDECRADLKLPGRLGSHNRLLLLPSQNPPLF